MKRLPAPPAALALMALATLLFASTALTRAMLQLAFALPGTVVQGMLITAGISLVVAGSLLVFRRPPFSLIPHPSSRILPSSSQSFRRRTLPSPSAEGRPPRPRSGRSLIPHPSLRFFLPRPAALRSFLFPLSSLLLALSLVTFGLARLPASNALWYAELELHADVQVREDCVREVSSASVDSSDPSGTTFTFDFRINNLDAPECKGVSYVEAYVCFDKGDVSATTQPSGWTYSPRKENNIKWEWSGGANPGDGTYTFTFTVPGATAATEQVDLLWKGGTALDVAGQITVPACPLSTSGFTTSSFGPSSFAAPADEPPPPVVVDPQPVYLGQTCSAFAPIGAAWTQFTVDASGGLADGVHDLDPAFAVTVSNASGTAFDWAATLAVEAVMVQTLSGSGNLYAYDPAALAGAGLASPNPDITAVTFCVDTATLETGAGDGDAGGAVDPSGDGSTPSEDPELDAPDKNPGPYDPNPGPFFSLDPGQQ